MPQSSSRRRRSHIRIVRHLRGRLSAPERATRLAAAIQGLHERYGEQIIRRASDRCFWMGGSGDHDSPVLSSGSWGVDLLIGGLPRGRIVEYAGVEGAGKETLALAALATCQRQGGSVLLVDADGAVDPDALLSLGIDLASLILVCPTTAQEAWEILRTLARCRALDLIVLASLSGLLTLPGGHGGPYHLVSTGALHRHLRRLALAVRGSPSVLLLINVPLGKHAGIDGSPSVVSQKAAVSHFPLIRSAHLSSGGPSNHWSTMGHAALARVAWLRLAVCPVGVQYTPAGDVAALRVQVQVLLCRGRGAAHPDWWGQEAASLEITAQGVDHSAELIAFGLLAGCLSQRSLGLIWDNPPPADSPPASPTTGVCSSHHGTNRRDTSPAPLFLGRSPAQAATRLRDDPLLQETLAACIRQLWMSGTAQGQTRKVAVSSSAILSSGSQTAYPYRRQDGGGS